MENPPQKLPTEIIAATTMGLLLTLISFASGYYFGQKSLANPIVVAQPLTKMTVANTALVTTWKTYTNKEFSFSYPDYLGEFTFNPQAWGETPQPAYVASYLDPNHGGGGPGYTLVLRLTGPEPNPEKLSLESWLKKNDIIQNINEIDDEIAERRFYFATDSGIYSLWLEILDTTKDKQKHYLEDFEKIISTIKLL